MLKPRQSFRITLHTKRNTCVQADHTPVSRGDVFSTDSKCYTQTYINASGRDGAVGIATRYGMDGPGIESRCGQDFPHPSRPALGPTQPPI